MCMLTYLPAGIKPTRAHLDRGAEINNDGHGFAVVTDDYRLHIRHSMDAGELLDEFEWVREHNLNGPALFHSRYATGGNVDTSNCHPFYVGRDPLTVMAHNGVMPADGQPAKNDWRSDTRYTAEELLADDPFNINSRAGRKRMGKWIGAYNKFVFLTVNPEYRRNGYIINQASGQWCDGTWYSNGDYKSTWNRHKWNNWSKWDLECRDCGPKAKVDWSTQECFECGRCIDCRLDWKDCDCYTPTTKNWVIGNRKSNPYSVVPNYSDASTSNAVTGEEVRQLALPAGSEETIEQWWARQELMEGELLDPTESDLVAEEDMTDEQINAEVNRMLASGELD